MTSREISEWMAYSTIEPFGELREDLRAGLIISTVANAAGTGKKKTFLPADWFPSLKPAAARGTNSKHEQQKQIENFKAIATRKDNGDG